MTRSWPGHHPTTQLRLLSILMEAASGGEDFSRDERGFCTACNFWATVASGELPAVDESGVIAMLHEARLAFEIVGAIHSACRIDAAVAVLGTTSEMSGTQQVLRRLTDELLDGDESVDDLLAQFAGRLTPSEPRR